MYVTPSDGVTVIGQLANKKRRGAELQAGRWRSDGKSTDVEAELIWMAIFLKLAHPTSPFTTTVCFFRDVPANAWSFHGVGDNKAYIYIYKRNNK
uniref:Uncharacterized protein n=1 Tax=Gasterosteus aculeatus TaxID=69293 RepID=G3Q769_GASAC